MCTFRHTTRRGNPLWLPWVSQARGRAETARGRNGTRAQQGRYKTSPYDGGGARRCGTARFTVQPVGAIPCGCPVFDRRGVVPHPHVGATGQVQDLPLRRRRVTAGRNVRVSPYNPWGQSLVVALGFTGGGSWGTGARAQQDADTIGQVQDLPLRRQRATTVRNMHVSPYNPVGQSLVVALGFTGAGSCRNRARAQRDAGATGQVQDQPIRW